jgi:cytochrome c553
MNKPEQALGIVIKAAGAALAVGVALVASGPAHAASIDKGKTLVEAHNCAACHGANFNKPISSEYPKLAGQHADYLVAAMRQYQMGTDNPLWGRGNAIMKVQVQSLSVNDMQDIAAYIESLPGDLVNKK